MLKFQNGINASPEKYGKGIKYISVSDILNNKFITNKNIKGLIDIDDKTFKNFEVSYGDILFQRSSETIEDIGRTNVYLDENTNSTFGGFVIRGKKIGHYNPIFFKYLLDSPTARKSIIRMGAGAQHYNISQEGLDKIKLHFPNDLIQEKIASLFMLIDNCIETQSKIIYDIESLIKGIRYQIFATKKNNFTNTKSFLLGDFLTEYSKKNNNNNLRSASIGKYGIRMRDEIYSKDLTNDYSKSKVIFKDTLSIGMGSTQIDIGILSEDEEYCISPAYSTYKIININSKYLNEYLTYLNPLLSKRYMVIGARQGKSVNKPELLNHELMIHSEQEQLEIVKIFSSLFNKLQKEKDILSLYKKQKAYLLQNMFI